MGKKAHLKFGAAYTFKHRDFNIQNFQITVGNIKFTGDPNEIFNPENLVSSTQTNGVRYDAMFIPNNPNEFKAMVNHSSVYGSNDWQLSPQLKAVVGLRAEHFLQQYTGISQTKNPLTGKPFELNNEAVMNDFNLFPTANMMYNISKKANLRISYARTIARPSLKELSYAEILDPITGRTFIGGKYTENTNINGQDIQLWDGNLKSTNINNFDIRWEQFEKGGDMISAGVFFKTLRNPIEIVQFLADAGSFQPRNVGNATILGLELEMRKNLEVLSSTLKNFSFNTNLTLTDSRISITETEFLSRDLTKRKGQTIERTRDMAGQAPYIVNVGLSHMTKNKSFESGLFYNVQGPTLQFVGFNNKTDVYSVPFHSLNFNATYKFGEKDRMNLGLKVTNILNDKREQIFTGFNASDQFFTRLSPGRNFQLKFSYTL
jgi:outer membrane receptor protein involved in Fe transport